MAQRAWTMQGQVCLVTGATSGIGRVTARALAGRGATVIVGARDRAKAIATVEEIQTGTDNANVDYLLADLSSQAQVRRMAQAFRERYERLDVLLNNAGAFFLGRQESVDGIEMTFAVNYLAPFLLTQLLLDVLKASAPARIINVTSAMHKDVELDFDDLQSRRRYGSARAYGRAKLALVLFTYELARRLEGTGVTANAVHPGFVATNIWGINWLMRLVKPLINLFAISPEEGAETLIYLATSSEVAGVTGRYFVDKDVVPSSPATYDEAAAERLWEISLALTDLNGKV